MVNFPMESWRKSFQYRWKFVWRALGQFSFGIMKKFLPKSMEICLESYWTISQWNTQGIPFKINRNWSGENPYGIPFKIDGNLFGELLVNFPMESLRNSFQNQWKFVWRESLWNSFQNQWKLVWRALGQFRSISQWNP